MKKIFYTANQAIIRVSRSKYFFYLALSLLFLVVGYLLSNPARFRLIVTGMIAFLLFTVVIGSIRKGIIAILILLPFMAFLRRAIYSVSPYVKYDPIHLIAPALVLFIFVGILLFDKERFAQAFKGNSLAKYVILLLGLFVLQIFNPLQGSLFVGLGGALYYVIPVIWFFFALCYANSQLIRKLMTVIVIIGMITGIYGLCQMVFGFLPFEEYWIETGGFASLRVGKFIRAFSTFSSPEEYSRYLQIAGVVAFGHFLRKRNLGWLLIFTFIGISTIMTGVRSSVFGLALSVLVLLIIWKTKDIRRAFIRLVLLVSAFLVTMSFVQIPSSEFGYRGQSIFYTMAGHTARGFVNPVGESTFQSRLDLWKYLFTDMVRRNPVGYGLGSTSIAAQKFGGRGVGTEGYIFALFVNSGVVGGLLFLIISLVVLKKGVELSIQSEGSKALAPPVLAIITGLTLNNIFGSSFILYSVAPVGWFLIGWIVREWKSSKRSLME